MMQQLIAFINHNDLPMRSDEAISSLRIRSRVLVIFVCTKEYLEKRVHRNVENRDYTNKLARVRTTNYFSNLDQLISQKKTYIGIRYRQKPLIGHDNLCAVLYHNVISQLFQV